MHVAFLIAKYGRGGVERMMANTASGLACLGYRVDYLAPANGPYLDQLDKSVRFQVLPDQKRERHRCLVEFLIGTQPEFVIVAKDRDLSLALSAKSRIDTTVKVVMRPGTAVSARLDSEFPLKRWISRYRIMRQYRRASAIVANSEAVRQDIAATTGIPVEQIFLVRNPVVTPALVRQALERVTHPWLNGESVPVILGVGNLHRVKDFATLIRAFGVVRQQREARLIILGDGHLRAELFSLAQRLNVHADVDLHGFVDNPYPFLKAADLFVLSSIREGSPNALAEALALGTPVVATDCPGGVREILQDGRYGHLVATRSPVAMADAMMATLDNPPSSAALQAAVSEYTLENNAKGYAAMLSKLSETSD